jgi:lipopolysaccharide export LptBFGC system permease protein LptF
VVVVGLYYPLEMFGLWLAERGALPPAAAMWIGNVTLLGLGLGLLRRVVRT